MLQCVASGQRNQGCCADHILACEKLRSDSSSDASPSEVSDDDSGSDMKASAPRAAVTAASLAGESGTRPACAAYVHHLLIGLDHRWALLQH